MTWALHQPSGHPPEMTTKVVVRKKSLFRRIVNRVLHKLARTVPGSMTLRPALHRWRGVSIGRGVFIGDEVYLENEYPELLEIGDGTAIGLRSVIIAHVGRIATKKDQIGGRVIIGKNVWVGACSFISTSPGYRLTIGDGAVISACSVIVGKNVPAQAFVKPPPSEQVGIARVALTAARSYSQFLTGLRSPGADEDKEFEAELAVKKGL